MILSRKDIEDIAAAVTEDFNTFFFGSSEEKRKHVQGTPIDQLAKEYLGLEVLFARLSHDGSICGLTAYWDTEYEVEDGDVICSIPLKRDQVLLDLSFLEPGQVRNRCGKRRFTLAHECAHQILFHLEPDEVRTSFENVYSERKAYSLRDLKSREDWNEWQANVLAAAILMPEKEMELVMQRSSPGEILTDYGGRFSRHDRSVIREICEIFCVSMSAAVIRLRDLGYVEDRPYYEFRDPPEATA